MNLRAESGEEVAKGSSVMETVASKRECESHKEGFEYTRMYH